MEDISDEDVSLERLEGLLVEMRDMSKGLPEEYTRHFLEAMDHMALTMIAMKKGKEEDVKTHLEAYLATFNGYLDDVIKSFNEEIYVPLSIIGVREFLTVITAKYTSYLVSAKEEYTAFIDKLETLTDLAAG